MSIERNSLALAATSVGSPMELASGAAGQSSERDLLASLRQIRATGRIVLKFNQDSAGDNSLPDIPLEDGDRFFVPSVPAVVNVVGAVYDQNSFLYSPGRWLDTYLRLAGGPNRDADWKHAFIIRADGQVLSRESIDRLWSGDFKRVRIYPGDTIIVPEKVFKPSAMRGILDWSQLFSQFALGAAALDVIK
jgi:hypothetical protein